MGGALVSREFGVGQLSGVIVVGIGLPPPSLQKDLVAKHFDVLVQGAMVAYTQPALTKVIRWPDAWSLRSRHYLFSR